MRWSRTSASGCRGWTAPVSCPSRHEAARDRQRHPGRARRTAGHGQADLPREAVRAARAGARHVRVRDARRCRTRRPRSSASSACCSAAAPSTSATCSSAPPWRTTRMAQDAAARSGGASRRRWSVPVPQAAPARSRPQRRAGLQRRAHRRVRPPRPGAGRPMSRVRQGQGVRLAARSRWSRWWARRRWGPRSTECSGCAAGCATRSSPPRCRRRWPRCPSTTRAAPA